MVFGGSVSLPTSTLGSTLVQPSTIVKYTLNQRIFNVSSNAIYLVLTSEDVHFSEAAFQQICGFHDSFVRNGMLLKYAVVGDKLAGCTYGGTHMATGLMANTLTGDGASPSNSSAADSIITTVVHELAETITDPEVGTGACLTIPGHAPV